MSNKSKQQPYITKPPTGALEVGSVPPRYQPPPQPGILKHPPSGGPIPSTSSAHPNLYPSKDGHKHPPYKIPDVKSIDPSKYYPQPGSSASSVPFHYPPQQLGIPHRQRIPDEVEDIRPIPNRHRAEELGVPEYPRHSIPTIQHRRISDEELLRLPPVEMLKFVRKTEGDSARIASEQHRHLQGLINEIRALKEANQRLGDDNQELRDLCCFLDDDRQKGRKLAREWQRFGRYTASVMRQEVSAYQNKLRELDNKQQELIKDNLELKELCLYLDEERGGSSVCPSCGSATSGGMRDDGDGSSSSTNADEPTVQTEFNGASTGPAPRRTGSRERLLNENIPRQRHTFNDQTMQYVRSLEQRVKQLEDEKRALQNKLSDISSDGDTTIINTLDTSNNGVISGRPEAVVRALQVLEVREQLEREGRVTEREQQRNPTQSEPVNGTIANDMDDGEKALVREMCNVVWRKLEEAPVARR